MARNQPTWSPLTRPVNHVFDMDSFDAHGLWASVTMRRWTAREQVAFRDLLGQEMISAGPNGDAKMLIGSMEAALICSLVQSWDGDWPDVVEREATQVEVRGRRRNPRLATSDGEPVTEAFDLRRREHLLALTDPDVYAELLAHAKEVQPDYMGNRALGPSSTDEDDEAGDGDLPATTPDVDEDGDPVDPPRRPRSTRSPARTTPAVVKGEVLTTTDGARRTSQTASPARRRTSQQAGA